LVNEFLQPKDKISLIVQYNDKLPTELVTYNIKSLDLNEKRIYKYCIKKQKGKVVFKIFMKNAALWREVNLLEQSKHNLLTEKEKIKFSYLAGKIDSEGHIDLIRDRVSLRYYDLEEAKFDKEIIESLGFTCKVIPNSRKKFDGWHLMICYLAKERTFLYCFCKKVINYLFHDKKISKMNDLLLKLDERGFGASSLPVVILHRRAATR
jgi:hypothetical protein